MTDKRFLESVARYLISSTKNLSNLNLVFPNKRSALFMKKYLEEFLVKTSSTPHFMPRYMTMGKFMASFTNSTEMERTEQLFLLYDCYRQILKDLGRENQLRDFDRFMFWGAMILDDFDDIDRQLADAPKLFKNLKDLKEINSDYLDNEQKELVRQIFGDSPRDEIITEFWTHVRFDNGNELSPESNFIALWQLLGQLYPAFNKALCERGYSTSGGQYRSAASIIADIDCDELGDRRFAFIGFNDLSKSELLVFKRLKELGRAMFFWDFDNTLLREACDYKLASLFKTLKKNFAMPDDFIIAPEVTSTDIEVIAVPSSVAQAKVVSGILEKWDEAGYINNSNPIDTAVVLPDEKLLIPLLYSIPKSIDSVNITMGINAANTPFATMLRSVVSMQLRGRKIHGHIHYYYADVVEVLSHPHIQLIGAKTAEDIKNYISKNNLFNINSEELCDSYPAMKYIFTPVKSLDSATDMCHYTLDLIAGLADALNSVGNNSRSPLPEIEMLRFFEENVERLNTLIKRYNIEMNENTFFSLIERFIRSLRIDLKGTPLRGLQIMGVLETRVLDFDNLIVLSMNENVFPRSSHMRTMIPNNLRIGYGLTSIDRQDSLYTYYFYHMLSRAHHVKLIYDSRTESFGAGEPSRYISQLRHITKSGHIEFSNILFRSEFNSPSPIKITKDDKVIACLRRFLPGGNGYLSASALKEYKQCRLRFYLRYVRNLRGDDNISEYIDASTYGRIVHKVAEMLYTRYKGSLIDSKIIESIIADTATIDNLMLNAIAEFYYHKTPVESIDMLPAEGQLACTIASHYLRRMLEIERSSYAGRPFEFIAGELDIRRPPWKISDELTINFKMSIDRVDRLSLNNLRFIDYKTGADKVEPTTLERIFTRERHDDNAIFQLLTYCTAYSDLVDPTCSIQPVVYPFRLMMATNEIPHIIIGGSEINDYKQIKDEFRAKLQEFVREIFNPVVPFDQAQDNNSCTFCPFLDLCGRTVPQKYN